MGAFGVRSICSGSILNDRIVDCKVGYANGAESKKDSAHGISLQEKFVGVIPILPKFYKYLMTRKS